MSSEAAAGAPPAESVPVDIFGLVGTTLERKFRVEKLVAEGGFGVVYYGTHLTLEKAIAIKVLKTPAEFNEKARAQFIEKFALEGKTMARISHPNIVQVLDFGASPMPSGDPAPWMVLEWITGRTLEALLEERRVKQQRLTPDEAITILRPVFEALAYAHDEGVAHRDIKPANMMVVQNKRGSSLRLMDFGIAKLMEEGEGAGSGATRTRTTMNAFSPQYAAPEQISGTRSGPWTDVHALALIFTEMLTNQMPYDGDDMTALFGQILSPIRPTPARRGVDVGALEPVLARALAMKPDERYSNCGEFLAAVDGVMPYVRAPGGTTGSFQTLGPGGVPMPTGMSPSSTQPNPAPTTLRGSTMTAEVAALQTKSRLPIFLGIGALVAIGAVGTVVAMSSHGNSAPATTARPPVSAPAAHAPTTGTPPSTGNTVVANTPPPPVQTLAPPVQTTPPTVTASTNQGAAGQADASTTGNAHTSTAAHTEHSTATHAPATNHTATHTSHHQQIELE